MEKSKKPEVVVGTYIISSKGKLLLVKSPKWGEQWMVPGGHIEYGERMMDAAKREVKEELGISVRPLGVLLLGEGIFPRTFARKKHFIYLETLCIARDEKVKIDGEEVTEYRWFEPREAIRVAKDRAIKATMREYMRQKRAGKFRFINI
ncbi:MAG: NUDIX domain-containing protein [Candidatus Micrarchaeota archaeon]|nr:NUDIX domain-containing protein [Candidatus Micrarchaeota archaeon]MDE1864552.1 NUDIX domain-containing protein [Candidatus Micrarchaeota archaeon]